MKEVRKVWKCLRTRNVYPFTAGFMYNRDKRRKDVHIYCFCSILLSYVIKHTESALKCQIPLSAIFLLILGFFIFFSGFSLLYLTVSANYFIISYEIWVWWSTDFRKITFLLLRYIASVKRWPFSLTCVSHIFFVIR